MNVKSIAAVALLSVVLPGAAMAANSSSMGNVTDFNAFVQGMQPATYTNASSEISSASSFKVVKLSSLKNADATKMNGLMTPHSKDIAALGTEITANAKAKAALDAQKLKATDVIWIDKASDGTVTLYVDDLAKK